MTYGKLHKCNIDGRVYFVVIVQDDMFDEPFIGRTPDDAISSCMEQYLHDVEVDTSCLDKA